MLRSTWLASSMSSSLTQGSSFTDGFFCPIDGQIPKCFAAQFIVVSHLSDQLFSELRTMYSCVQPPSTSTLQPQPALTSHFFSYAAADGNLIFASYLPADPAPAPCSVSPTAPCLLNNAAASIRALTGVPLQGSAAQAVWHSPSFPALSLMLLPLAPTFAPLPFRIVVASGDWSDAVLRAASSTEQASFIASPVGMTVTADGHVQLPQSVSASAAGFGMYQLSFAATHASGLFSVLQHVLVRVCGPASDPPPTISFANASSDFDHVSSRFVCFPRQRCVLRVIASHNIMLGNQSVPNPSTTVSIGNSSVAGSSHLLELVQPGNPAVYDLVFMHLTPNQQPSDADTGREEALCLQALASSGCPSPPACLSLRISSRPPVILQPAAPALSSCEEQTASLIFNISNNDPLETISFKFDELPLPLAAYGVTVGDALVLSDSSGVQHLTFQVNLTTFSQGLQSKRDLLFTNAAYPMHLLLPCMLLLICRCFLRRWPRRRRVQRSAQPAPRPTHLRDGFRQCSLCVPFRTEQVTCFCPFFC